MTHSEATILKKKIGAIQARGYSFPIQSELAAKLEYAAAKGVTKTLRATTEAIVDQSRVGRLNTLIDVLPVPGLSALLDFKAGGTAVIGLDMQLVNHIVDILSGGDPNSARNLPARTPTSIDTALCLQVIDAIMVQFDAELRALASGIGLGGYTHGRIEHVPAGLQYILPDSQYVIFQVNLDIGDDARSGALQLAIPVSCIEPVETMLRQSGIIRAQGESENWSRHMRQVVNRTQVKLDAVIDRFPMAVAELSRLKVGGIFPLTDVTLDDVVLELKTGGEPRTIGRGRLGTFKRNKAVRLITPPQRSFLEPLADSLGLDTESE